MSRTRPPAQDYIEQLPDGTVKQRNPFSGTEVWTVPGRGHRPLGIARPAPRPLDPDDDGRHCAFCSARLLQTPPEKSRVVRTEDGEHAILRDVPAKALFDTVPEFRRVPNLFEILSYEYWRLNHGFVPAPGVADRRAAYLATEAGRAHVLAVVGNKLRATGRSAEEVEAMPEEERLEAASGFFGGGHDVIIGRRHFTDGAQDALGYAAEQGLMIARNEHAAMFAGFGHRYPTVEIHSLTAACEPWAQTGAERDAMADLIHAAHAATGADVPSIEEWHTRPAGVDEPLPWRVCLKWRVSTLAGFEGATKIYLNTVSPGSVRDRVVARLQELQATGAIADGIRVDDGGRGAV